MDVARLNFSHGDREDHKRVYDMIRHAADSEGHAVGILADLQGPKIRLGRFAAGPTEWRAGEEVRIRPGRQRDPLDRPLQGGRQRRDRGRLAARALRLD
jgi:pyruvate kinase